MQNFRALGAPPLDPRASGGWGLCPQTPSLRQLAAPSPHWPRQLRAPPPDPQTALPHCEFLATRLVTALGNLFVLHNYKVSNFQVVTRSMPFCSELQQR